MKRSRRDFTFFWSGPFSQWAMYPIAIDGQIYCCNEQYMMAEKARLFGEAEKPHPSWVGMRTTLREISKKSYRKEGVFISSVELTLYAEGFQVQDISESRANSDV